MRDVTAPIFEASEGFGQWRRLYKDAAQGRAVLRRAAKKGPPRGGPFQMVERKNPPDPG